MLTCVRLDATFYWWDHDIFAVAARYLLENTPASDKIREIVHGTLSEHTKILKKSDMAQLLFDFPELSYELVMKRVHNGDWLEGEMGSSETRFQ